jgi:hypothetical protein
MSQMGSGHSAMSGSMSGLPESGQGWEIYELVRESGSLPARSRKPTAKCRDPPPPPQARPPPRARAACLLPRRLHRRRSCWRMASRSHRDTRSWCAPDIRDSTDQTDVDVTTLISDVLTQLAFALFENKGVFAVLLGSGLSRAAEIPTGWEITLDLIRRVALAQGTVEQLDWANWYHETTGQEPNYSTLLEELAGSPEERRAILHRYIEPTGC